ncbi:MAG: hypothetical protein ACFFHD_06035 [Promethearchaeota archaeon]
MRFKIIRKKNIKLFLMLIIIASISIGTTIFLIYMQSSKEISDFYEISSEKIDISEIQISNQIQRGDITLAQSIKEPINIFEAKWKINYKGIYNPNEIIIISYELNVSVLKIYIYSDLDEQALDKDILYSNLTLFINPNYDLYGFRSNSKKGNIQINTHNINISIFEIETSSGSINVQLNNSEIFDKFRISTSSGTINLILDNINFFTDFLCVSDSSYQYHDFWNIKFMSGADFTAMSSTGRIKVRWANHFLKSQNVNILLMSNDNIEFRFWSRIEIVRFDILLLCSDQGTTRFRGDPINFEEIEIDHYRSYNFNNIGLDLLNIKVITTFGEAQVWHTDCFKMKRFCNYRDIDPYEENLKGDYMIPKKDHNVSQIELYNLKYTYLNIRKALNLNLVLSPNISENIIYLNWDLTYIKGSAYGMGDFKVEVSNKTEENCIKVYIQLEFELDRLLPTITECNFTLFIHSGYDFYNYTI